jgi:F-type H+-transporting ATPase subunit alpha
MVDVRPDEVSAILRQQLAGFKSAAELEEVGTVPKRKRWRGC